ncbi:DUF5117 domain-containing protein [Oxynema aestuarii AP17]|uniref:DUF5117 domain-containing protein n=1 Tax=Oxynema aestuarii AP17 TaxID=2064643 RepID=A0A6H1U474_9CYAN|nr:DUF5117 domain-containing protein [Oxynema aestuarii AP17]
MIRTLGSYFAHLRKFVRGIRPRDRTPVQSRWPHRFRQFLLLFLAFVILPIAWSLVPFKVTGQTETEPPTVESPESAADDDSETNDLEDNLEKFDEAIADTEPQEGLFSLYRNDKKNALFLELQPQQLDKNFLCAISLASGIGERGLFDGMPLQNLLFYFHRVNDKIEFVVRNVYFRTRPGDPMARSLDRSFSDSVLAVLPIKSIHPDRQSLLVDLNTLLLDGRDLSGLSAMIPFMLRGSYVRDPEQSRFSRVQTFPLNVEIETVYGYTGGEDSFTNLEALPDNRGFTLRLNYSISALPENNGYRPRLADNRIGYFITAYRDYADENRKEAFTRYINRWHLEKQNPDAPLSPPKQPIVFWIENTVPVEYRDAIREGILAWNKAFEKAGFIDAIEAREMPDDAEWNPADVRYNTIRWMNSFDPWFAGIGPSRVNPLTGEILDADILIDGNIVRLIQKEFRNWVGEEPTASTQFLGKTLGNDLLCLPGITGDMEIATSEGATDRRATAVPTPLKGFVADMMERYDLCYGMEAPQQFAIGSLGLSMFHNALPSGPEMETYLNQYLTFLVAHEVGHTLGLRHNFHGSTMLAPEQLHDRSITRTKGLVASVMDYVPVNLAPPGVEQGDFYPVVVGPYDEWAIEYGYKPLEAMSTALERRDLEAIARRAGDPELAYAPDEDTMDILNPGANLFDMSGDMLQFSRWQLDNAREMWERLDKRYPVSGESYSEVREIFDMVYFFYIRNVMNATLYVGGQWFNRNHAGDREGRLPFEPVAIEKQRESLALLQEYVFDDNALQFPPQLLNKLAPDRWYHWGSLPIVFPLDYPIHQRILLLQRLVLRALLSDQRLTRLHDLELKAQPGEILTLTELFDTLQRGIWTEVLDNRDGLTEISSVRRSLQREDLGLLMNMVLRRSPVPEEARTLAWYQLKQLREAIDRTVDKRGKHLETASKAHLQETRARIDKTLDAQIQSF